MTSRRERGQATVEFALVIPLVLVTLLGVVQVGLVAYAQLEVTHRAREAARVLAVDPGAANDDFHRRDLVSNAALGSEDMVYLVHFDPVAGSDRETVTVSVTYDSGPIIGLFSPFSDYFAVHGEVQMLVEP